jgi:hypothetical protein
MSGIAPVGLDLAKDEFLAHGASASGQVLFRNTLKRDEVPPVFSQVSPHGSAIPTASPPSPDVRNTGASRAKGDSVHKDSPIRFVFPMWSK